MSRPNFVEILAGADKLENFQDPSLAGIARLGEEARNLAYGPKAAANPPVVADAVPTPNPQTSSDAVAAPTPTPQTSSDAVVNSGSTQGSSSSDQLAAGQAEQANRQARRDDYLNNEEWTIRTLESTPATSGSLALINRDIATLSQYVDRSPHVGEELAELERLQRIQSQQLGLG